jgi:NitT/TauT family transport system ATP-binding protein
VRELEFKIWGVSKSYGDLRVMQDFERSFSENKIHCFLGHSGCGKTTLLHILGGLLKPDQGRLEGLKERTFSMVFQEDRLMPWATVEENLSFVLSHQTEPERMKRIHTYLSLVELLEFKNKYPMELSGGMKQRLSIARALSYGGDILMMDEPFKGIHPELKKKLMDHIVKGWKGKCRGIFLITHDIEEALKLGDEIYIFKGPPLTLHQQFSIAIPHQDRSLKNPLIEEIKKKILEQI